MVAVIGLIVAGAGLVTAAESEVEGANITSFSEGLWWAIVTCTTVGYGDHSPVSAAGRGVAIALMLVGIGLIGVLTANIAAWFVEAEKNSEMDELRRELAAVHEKLDHLLQKTSTTQL